MGCQIGAVGLIPAVTLVSSTCPGEWISDSLFSGTQLTWLKVSRLLGIH